jgi:hypothetical protein
MGNGKITSNGSVTLFLKKDYPNNECFMVYHTSRIWRAPFYLGIKYAELNSFQFVLISSATISVDSFSGSDVLLISSNMLNIQPVQWTTAAISWKNEPSLLYVHSIARFVLRSIRRWSGDFNQGASQNSFLYAVVDNVIGKYDVLV